jgi:hypothetical protein
MRLTLRFSGGKKADFGEHDYEGILSTALARFSHRLKQVTVYIEDTNGPRGGIDKQCRCILHLRRMPPVVIQDQDESMNSLIHRVANRASYALSQKAERNNRHRPRARSTGGSLESSDEHTLPTEQDDLPS